ncbi:Succinyl-CoA ligase [ADP-forming] subunit alpha [Novipirellula galeiformis]|uniref:Succinyl-CoA ligase [ADP-forming] subunit alpha n=1 Tax=Novipirellula galeiformis TaxID=2528004 RepID=A0A5C6CHP5_9BACT|nr:bifunctional acetate--CoA ligase family protein/GNAT family N-acetyltransferase [Novipirellula galeiformis]TWU24423.1 Succinyl-CoA ligase [ADP-forming] subunit alpha [Novipirellula galeiformis]
MPIRNLSKIFTPTSIAIIGASNRAGSVGQRVLQNLIEGQFQGELYPVNAKHSELAGHRCFPSLSELPLATGAVVDLAVICTPAATVAEVVRQCGEAGILGVVILSAGFREIGLDGERIEAEIRTSAKRFEGMRILGPNSLGLMSPYHGLNASFAADGVTPGRVAFISQSGALCASVLDWAAKEGIGFSHFVSVGNMLDIGVADLIDYFASDRWTDSIILYVESISHARQFMSAARAFTRSKPIIVYKAGRFDASEKAAATHTGAMIGLDNAYEAALTRAGAVRVWELADLFDCAELLAGQEAPAGPRLAIVTNAGGPGVMATDALLQRKGTLAELSDASIQKLDGLLPEAWSHGNPIDVLSDADADRFGEAVAIALADKNVDGVLVILSPQIWTQPLETADAVIKAANRSRKPVLTAWMGGTRVQAGIEHFSQAGVPSYATPEKAVASFMYLVQYARNRSMLYETPRSVPLGFRIDRDRLRTIFRESVTVQNGHRDGNEILSESDSKALLEAYDIPVCPTVVAGTKEAAMEIAQLIGYPVVMKICSPSIVHKSDVGGVALNLIDRDSVARAFDSIVAKAKQKRPDAVIDGVTVQPMTVAPWGRELFVGAKRGPVFGSVLMVGLGGTATELLWDRTFELPPLSERLARRMLESLRAWPLLGAYRGRDPVDLDQLVEVLMRISYLVADAPEILELDINPLLATPTEVVALDARIVLQRAAVLNPPAPYSHLAICPYPTQFTHESQLGDGTPVLMRVIQPEDEPMWCELISGCSMESIQMRFRYMFRNTTHEMASRFCFNDYDREIAIVAEVNENGRKAIAGVGRLVADVDHQEVEFAVLVGDAWQGRGLGSELMDYCLKISEQWRVQKIVAEIAPQNRRMLEMFSHRGFTLNRSIAADVVVATKRL